MPRANATPGRKQEPHLRGENLRGRSKTIAARKQARPRRFSQTDWLTLGLRAVRWYGNARLENAYRVALEATPGLRLVSRLHRDAQGRRFPLLGPTVDIITARKPPDADHVVTTLLGVRRETRKAGRGRPGGDYPTRSELSADAADAWQAVVERLRWDVSKLPQRDRGWYGTQAGSVIFETLCDNPRAAHPARRTQQGRSSRVIFVGTDRQGVAVAVRESLAATVAGTLGATTLQARAFRAGTDPAGAGAWRSAVLPLTPRTRGAAIARLSREAVPEVRRRFGRRQRFDAHEVAAAVACVLTGELLEREGDHGGAAQIAEALLNLPVMIGRRPTRPGGPRPTPPAMRTVQRHMRRARELVELVR